MKPKRLVIASLLSTSALMASTGFADEPLSIDLYQATEDGQGSPIGDVTFEDTQYGLLITPSLKNLTPGEHGWHVHERPDCGPATKDGEKTAAAAAGSHYDPQKKGAHKGPYHSDGHLGDLPALFVADDGQATRSVLAPRLEAADLHGRALVVHEGGDNYSDDPKALGGGGARVACGVIQAP